MRTLTTVLLADGAGGVEIWKTDATAAGTQRLADLGAGFLTTDPVAVGARVFFGFAAPIFADGFEQGTSAWSATVGN